MKKIRLFCIPYAGGSALIYKKWEKLLDKNIEMYPVEIAGRGTRFKEQCSKNLMAIVEDLYKSIIKQIGDEEYAILGYSMGSIISYEIIRKLQKDGYKQPIHAFFCAQNPPHKLIQEKTYLLPKDKFYDKIYELGGTAREVIDNKDIQIVFDNILRSDYEAFETYVHYNSQDKILCKSSILIGTYDEGCANVDNWKDVVKNELKCFEFNGNHFFINEYSESVFDVINSCLFNKNLCR